MIEINYFPGFVWSSCASATCNFSRSMTRSPTERGKSLASWKARLRVRLDRARHGHAEAIVWGGMIEQLSAIRGPVRAWVRLAPMHSAGNFRDRRVRSAFGPRAAAAHALRPDQSAIYRAPAHRRHELHGHDLQSPGDLSRGLTFLPFSRNSVKRSVRRAGGRGAHVLDSIVGRDHFSVEWQSGATSSCQAVMSGYPRVVGWSFQPNSERR